MLADFLVSIAGKKRNTRIDELLLELSGIENLSPKDKRALSYTKEVVDAGGAYPPKEWYQTSGYEPFQVSNSLAELALYVKNIKESYSRDKLQEEALRAFNESSTSSEIIDKLRKLAMESDKNSEDIDLDAFSAAIQDLDQLTAAKRPYKIGISDVDTITGGQMPGTVFTIGAFTSEGKSTLVVSSIFKNIKEGAKGVLFSIELPPQLVKLQFFSRYLYEMHSITITPEEFMSGQADEKTLDKAKALKDDFNKFISDKLLILDESFFNKRMLQDYHLINKLYSALDKHLGCLNFVAIDHVNQIELMFKDLGNVAIRSFTSATKTFINSEGENPCTIMAAQVNREGKKRAAKRNGKYDLIAIGDLNEVEKSSTYVLFLFTSDDMKLMQETKVSLAKNRLGALLTEPVTTNFNAPVFFVGEEIETISNDSDFDFLGTDTKDISFSEDDFSDF